MTSIIRLGALTALLAGVLAPAAGTATSALASPRPPVAPIATATAPGGQPAQPSRLWVARLKVDGGAVAEAVSPDGSTVYVTGSAAGTSYSAGSPNPLTTLAYNAATGARLWIARAPRYSAGCCVAVSPDGSTVFVATQTADTTAIGVVAYDATTGQRVWASSFRPAGGSPGMVHALAVSPGGTQVFLAVDVPTGNEATDVEMVAFNASTGARQWSYRHSGDGTWAYANSVAVSPGGGQVFLAAIVKARFVTFGFNAATGAPLWVNHYSLRAQQVNKLVVSPDGSTLYVVGQIRLSPLNSDATILAISAATGGMLWTRWYHSQGTGNGNGDNWWVDAVVSQDGSTLFVTGDSNGQYLTGAYDTATGRGLWTRRYGEESSPVALALSPGGSVVYATGDQPRHGEDMAYTTVGYAAATGDYLWQFSYSAPVISGPVWAIPSALVVSPVTGDIYVTGDIAFGGGYVTAAWQP